MICLVCSAHEVRDFSSSFETLDNSSDTSWLDSYHSCSQYVRNVDKFISPVSICVEADHLTLLSAHHHIQNLAIFGS